MATLLEEIFMLNFARFVVAVVLVAANGVSSPTVAQPPPPGPPTINTFSVTSMGNPPQPGVVQMQATYINAPLMGGNTIKASYVPYTLVNGVSTPIPGQSKGSGRVGGSSGSINYVQSFLPSGQLFYVVFELFNAGGAVIDTKTSANYIVP